MNECSTHFYLELYRGHYTDQESFFILPATTPTPMGIQECLCGRTISNLPPLLVLRLIQPQHVNNNQLTLDLNELLPADSRYHLFGITLFRGEHYTALCYSPEINKWIYYRSTNVTILSQFSSSIISEHSYLLFYRRDNISREAPHSSLNSPPSETREHSNLTTTTISPPSNRPCTPNPMPTSPNQPLTDALCTPPTSQINSPFHQHILHSTGPTRSVPHTLPKRKIHKQSVCSECGIELHSSNVTRHKLTHQFPCPECNDSFSTSDLLQRHREKVHPLGLVYECPFNHCAYASESWSLYRQHIRRVHLAKQYQCPECHLIIPRIDNFRRHMDHQHPRNSVSDPSQYRVNQILETMDRLHTVREMYPGHDFNELMNSSSEGT